jgi:hypothetical protein
MGESIYRSTTNDSKRQGYQEAILKLRANCYCGIRPLARGCTYYRDLSDHGVCICNTRGCSSRREDRHNIHDNLRSDMHENRSLDHGRNRLLVLIRDGDHLIHNRLLQPKQPYGCARDHTKLIIGAQYTNPGLLTRADPPFWRQHCYFNLDLDSQNHGHGDQLPHRTTFCWARSLKG